MASASGACAASAKSTAPRWIFVWKTAFLTSIFCFRAKGRLPEARSIGAVKGNLFLFLRNSFFGFSTENWNREKKEIDYIFEVAYNLVEKNQDNFEDKNIKFVAMGELSRFPEKLRNILTEAMEKTKNNTGLVVNLAMNYGGRDDIVHAVNSLIEKGEKKITVENLKENLYSAPSPDIDLLVRTSGEMRVSNFMLFQMAYSELYFTKTCWPDFGKKELYKALEEFSKRNRRFGGK